MGNFFIIFILVSHRFIKSETRNNRVSCTSEWIYAIDEANDLPPFYSVRKVSRIGSEDVNVF